ncbi:MAG: hypothetical protein AB4290_21760 [Spirulina sp.]
MLCTNEAGKHGTGYGVGAVLGQGNSVILTVISRDISENVSTDREMSLHELSAIA